MTHVYKPSENRIDPPIDIERCKAAVYNTLQWRFFQCQRKKKKDGWCFQHHPDAEKKRTQERKERWEAQWANRPEERLRKANERIKELEAEVADLQRRLEG